MYNRWIRYITTGVFGVLFLWGIQELIYPLGSNLTYKYVRAFGSEVLEHPVGITVDHNRVYVTDTGNDRIAIFSKDGELLGTGGSTGSDPGQFRRPMRLESGPNDNLYVADLLNHRIQLFTSRGKLIKTYGSDGDVNVTFNQPAGIDVDREGNLYVVEFMGHRVQKISPQGKQLATWGVKDTKGFFHYGYFNYPTDVAVTNNGHFYVTDTFNDRIKHHGPGGERLYVWGGLFGLNTPGPFRGWFRGAYGLAVSNDTSRVFVTDWGNNRVQVFDRNGNFLTTFGSGENRSVNMSHPTDVTIGDGGTVYVMDFASDRVQVWEPKHDAP